MTNHTGAQPELLTIAETAEFLRVPVATLRYWRHLGTGPRSFRLGRHVMYRRDDVRGWIDLHSSDEVNGSSPRGSSSTAR